MDIKLISEIEQTIPTNRKILLYCLRENNWDVVGVYEEPPDVLLEQVWYIESLKENRGFYLELKFLKYVGLYDGVDRVEVLFEDKEIEIDFDANRFEEQLAYFCKTIHSFRIKI